MFWYCFADFVWSLWYSATAYLTMLIVVSAESWGICDSDGPETSEQPLYLTFCIPDTSEQALYLTSWIPDTTEWTPYLTFCKSGQLVEWGTGWLKVRVVDFQNSSWAVFLIADLLKSEESEESDNQKNQGISGIRQSDNQTIRRIRESEESDKQKNQTIRKSDKQTNQEIHKSDNQKNQTTRHISISVY